MGLLELKRLMHVQRERRQRQIQARCRWIASGNKRKDLPCEQDCVADGSICSRHKKKGSPCQQDCVADRSITPRQQDSSTKIFQDGPNLPEDIWCHIHSLMPLRDAARAACVSRTFRRSWRCYPNLIFSTQTFGLNGYMHRNYSLARVFTSRVDHILKKHSGDGIKSLELLEAPNYRAEDRYHLDSWLEKAVTPVLEELRLHVYSENDKYEFPCSLFSHGNADSIRCLRLSNCTFRPTVGLGCLTVLDLFMVRITGDELGSLLSSSFALERLQLRSCERISCLMIPCHVPSLSYLEVLSIPLYSTRVFEFGFATQFRSLPANAQSE